MNAAAARVSLTQLITEGALEPVPVDADVIGHLRDQARNHLRTAKAGLDGGDNEGAFQLAYDACRKHCMALVLAAGYSRETTRASRRHVRGRRSPG